MIVLHMEAIQYSSYCLSITDLDNDKHDSYPRSSIVSYILCVPFTDTDLLHRLIEDSTYLLAIIG